MAVGEGRARRNRSLLGTRIAGLGASSFLPQEMLRQEAESDVHCVILYREIGTFLIAPDFRMINNRVEGSLGNAFSHIHNIRKFRPKNFFFK